MGAIVKVRNVKLGDGMPKICIPVTDTNLDDLKKSVNLIRNTPFDLIEWRADFYTGMEDPEVRTKAMTLFRNTLGNIRVLDFKTSHVRTFFSVLSDEGLAHSTIKGLYGLLNPSFELAVEDGIIRKNPVTGTLGDYGAPAKEKEALTLEQQEKLLKFVEQSNVYKPHLPMMQVMFGACLRVSETIGLTWSDVDMKNREIHVGGRSGFIFNTKHGRPIMPAGVNSFLKNIVNAYNKKESKLAEEEKREPELMPPISSHTLRHTGCTRLGENNVNPKVMQYVMGHSDAQITMNVYNHISDKSHVENEMSKMNLPETVPAVV